MSNEQNSTYLIDPTVGIQDGYYGKMEYRRDEAPRFKPMGSAVYLKKVLIDSETQEQTLVLEFFDAKGKAHELHFPRMKLTEQSVLELLSQGVQVTKKSAHVLISTILNQEPNVEQELYHSQLGFREYDGIVCFFGSQSLGVESQYKGNLAISPQGDLQLWLSIVKEEMLGTPLELVLAAASAAPIIDLLHDELMYGNLLISLVGESSTGKSTDGIVGVSLGAKPSLSGNSMVTSFGDTVNSIMHGIYSAYPHLTDEGSLITYNPTSFLYSLGEGKERARLTKTYKRAEMRNFHTTIFFTSEKSLLQLCDSNTGLMVRCLEFENITYTKNAESADRIKQVCEQNYGFIIPLIAKKLLQRWNDEKDGKEGLLSEFEALQNAVIAKARKENKWSVLTPRLAKCIALIQMGRNLFEDVTGIALSQEYILELITDNTAVFDPNKLDIGTRFIDFLCQFITVNYTQFVHGKLDTNKVSSTPRCCKGRIQPLRAHRLEDGQLASVEVFLPKVVFQEILSEGGFKDEKVILKRLKEKGLLHSDKDRYISRFVIANPPQVSGYRIYLPTDKELKTVKKTEKELMMEFDEMADITWEEEE